MGVAADIRPNPMFAKKLLEAMTVFRVRVEVVALVSVPTVMVVRDRYNGFVAEHKDEWFCVFLQVFLQPGVESVADICVGSGV